MRAAPLSAWVLCLLTACPAAPPAPDDPPPDAARPPADLRAAPEDGAPPSGDLTLQCRSDKMSFPRERGCENDGSVEFCLPAGDGALLALAQAIAPTLRCAPGGGRARCDAARELLCLFPTGEAQCVTRYGALTDEAWATLCGLAALPEVRRIVPTFFE